MINVQVKSITVKKSRIICLINLSEQKFSNEKIKNALLKIRPSLKDHKCKNKQSKNFIDVIGTTSISHILEHLIIDFQIEYATKAGILDQVLFGTSEWIDQASGSAKIEFDYFDDVVAIRSINDSIKLLEKI